jgi:hypothetical protein
MSEKLTPVLRVLRHTGGWFPLDFLRPDETVTVAADGALVIVGGEGRDVGIVVVPVGASVHRLHDGTLALVPETGPHGYVPDGEGACWECGGSDADPLHLTASIAALAEDDWTSLDPFPDSATLTGLYSEALAHAARAGRTVAATVDVEGGTAVYTVLDGRRAVGLAVILGSGLPAHAAVADLPYIEEEGEPGHDV